MTEDEFRQAEVETLLGQKAYIGGEGRAYAIADRKAVEQQQREQALNLAASMSHGTAASASDILADARKYLKFLKGDAA